MEKGRSMSTNKSRDRKSPSAAELLTFNVSGLLGEPAGTIRDLEISAPPLDLGPDLHQHGDVEGRVRLTRTNRGLLVQGRLSTSIDVECSRCLRELDYPLDLEIDEEALPVVDFASGLPVDTSTEPDVLRLTDHHELDLEEEVREAILLAEPIAPLCREDCPGLCVVCGFELSSGPHEHADEDIDPRLEGLRDLLPPEDR
jgi:uncharacterized protein